LENAVF